ncbi:MULTISPECIES: SEL1-like repeat protein [Avibacterium]|uniref:SEL1-like repeat protein n=1 Tax=Avibacterium TaxID=292486 RepID=UPI0021F7985A|nr:SEL1-like repeat protein [Avibacterium paragallinarum]UXN35685.1 SEL1-like repeat protein [Avibacterium paragallinarum]
MAQGLGENITGIVDAYNMATKEGEERLYYEYGLGVKQDKRKAKEYYGLVCDSGEQLGCDNYRKLNEAGTR